MVFGKEPDPEEARLIDVDFVLHAEQQESEEQSDETGMHGGARRTITAGACSVGER